MVAPAPLPVTIKRIASEGRGSGVEIAWSDGRSTTLVSEQLRTACPCAVCNEKRGDRSHQKPLTEKPLSQNPPSGRGLLTVVSATKDESCDLEKLWLVGNYAVGIRWADGHDSGIYTFQFLHALSTAQEE